MGTNRSLASISEVNSTIGPSAPPMVATDAACPGFNPMATASGKMMTVPNSANSAMIML